MFADLMFIAGGLGLFLFGLVVLTDGLRDLAGDTLRRLLARFTRTPLAGAITGAVTTAIIQSSSATTVTAISFVSAGLLTFPQALGVVFGANIGTTITGWIVAIVGFKLNLGLLALPLILVGALLRIFARDPLRQAGWALAGFGLLFVGIDTMRDGMGALQGIVTPADFPGDTFWGRLQLVAIGIAITLVTQSSSAGVAITLVAIGAGAISFTQGAAMVIGMDIGTTFTAALAVIGGSTATRQTGYGQIIYNILTGCMALALLTPFAAAVDTFVQGGQGNAQIALVLFHSLFNVVGVIVILPFAGPFSRLITWLIPERGPPLLRHLDDRLLRDPASATAASLATIREIALAQAGIVSDLLNPATRGHIEKGRMRPIEDSLQATRLFLERIRTEATQRPSHDRHLATMHALDHLNRLSDRCHQTDRTAIIVGEPRLRQLSEPLRDAVSAFARGNDPEGIEHRLDEVRRRLRQQRHAYREQTVDEATRENINAELALKRLDSVRWLHRVAYHLWRISHHLNLARETPEPSDPVPLIEEEREED